MSLSRRAFLGTAAAAAAPYVIPASALGKAGRPSPANRITMGLIGAGGMGMSNLNHFLGLPDAQVVAACDVDLSRKGSGRQGAKEAVERKYGEAMKSGAFKGCDVYKDFRELCARKDIDAVIVATPDHWHALTALEAIRNGKDVYGEKPIVHLWQEGKVLVDTVKEKERIWQTGSQQRSDREFRRAVELVRNGLIGKIKDVEVGLPTGHKKSMGDKNERPIPEGFDYDFWCGPSKMLPFVPARVHFHWRWHLNYGGGQLMDWIGHHNDIAHWSLDMDQSGPTEVEGVGFTPPIDKELYDAPVNYMVICQYPNGVRLTISDSNKMGTRWIGESGWIHVTRGRLEASNPEWTKNDFDPGPWKAYPSSNHRQNFLDCVKSRKPTICPAETSFRSITPGFLGYVSHQLNRKIKWDPIQQKTDDPEAEALLTKVDYRGNWKLGG